MGDQASENAPHPHFVSPSPRKKTRGEGLSIAETLGLRAIASAVSLWSIHIANNRNRAGS